MNLPIVDPFLRFWFRYVHPYQSALELGLADSILEQRIRPTFDQYCGAMFEEAARFYIAQLAHAGQLPFLPDRIGSWWDATHEIDAAAVHYAEKTILLAECKWSAHPVSAEVWEALERKAQALLASGQWEKARFMLFAKAGFSKEMAALAKERGIRLVDAGQMTTGMV